MHVLYYFLNMNFLLKKIIYFNLNIIEEFKNNEDSRKSLPGEIKNNKLQIKNL